MRKLNHLGVNQRFRQQRPLSVVRVGYDMGNIDNNKGKEKYSAEIKM